MTRYRVGQLAHKYMNYDMISKHTDLPEYPDSRIRMLHAVLSYQPAVAGHRELFSLVTSLVQMGLDTHDLVECRPQGGKGGLLATRAQQLKVLAGDYFSSRFYSLLSQAGQIDVVRRLSEAVCELNRTKMSGHAKMKQLAWNPEEHLQYGAQIKSGLFLSFTGLMHGLYERLWPELVARFCRCEVLLQELTAVQRAEKLAGSWGFWHVIHEGSEEDRRTLPDLRHDVAHLRRMMDKYFVTEKLSELLRQSAQQLREFIHRIPSEKLMNELQTLIEPFFAASGPEPAAAALKELG